MSKYANNDQDNVANNYYSHPDNDLPYITNKIYVQLAQNYTPKITFNTYKNSMEITYDIWLNGDFNIPPYLLNLDVDSSIGNISNIPLKEVENVTNEGLHHFKAHCNISFSNAPVNANLLFLEEWHFKTFLSIDANVFTAAKLDTTFDGFLNDLSKIELNSQILFSNYFPINKLTAFYVSKQYQNKEFLGQRLPHDYFTWEKSNLTSYPDYYFNRVTKQTYSLNETINDIYQSNIGQGNLANYFNKIQLIVEYYILEKKYTTTLNLLPSDKTTSKQDNYLSLNCHTVYDFRTHQLLQNSTGVQGIYFPEKTYGTVNVTMVKGSQRYIDKFDFNFSQNLYSAENPNLNITVTTLSDTNINWHLAT
ncbi:hypothetical protein [Ureaplasma ceti]|uniref:Uncharacterized protein n=1 Tax=Ureaplasma ceti TaxID=3119530 RepID=A0ABP9UD59_9BACT